MAKWRVVLERDETTNDWGVWCPELPGCTSVGISKENALENIKEAIELYLQPEEIEIKPEMFIEEVNF